jgi:DNA repair exonuclease SbcCD ATPase subunit
MDDDYNSDEVVGGVTKAPRRSGNNLPVNTSITPKEQSRSRAKKLRSTLRAKNIGERRKLSVSSDSTSPSPSPVEQLDKAVEPPPSPVDKLDEAKEEKIIEEAVDTVDIFDELPVVFIGMYSFDNEQLVEEFGDKSVEKEKIISLLKRVFQKKYPITRSNGLPKIPSKKGDKELLDRLLENYFDRLRAKIIRERKKHGNSMDLRQKIEQIQQIKVLQYHFENGKEKFPYHLFQNYIDNEDSIDFKEDLVQQIQKLRFKENEDKRVRNLLRQFAKLYLLQRNNEEFTLSDPGESEERFKKFIAELKGKILPPILRTLIDLLQNQTKLIAQEKGEEVNYDKLYDLLKKLSDEFDVIEKEGTSPQTNAFPANPSGGGDPYPITKDKPIDESMEGFVRHLFEEYKKLREAHRQLESKHSGELSAKDAKHSEEITKLKGEKEDAEAQVEALAIDVKKFLEYQRINAEKIEALGVVIRNLEAQLVEKTAAESRCSEEIAALRSSTNSQAQAKAAELLELKEKLLKEIADTRKQLTDKQMSELVLQTKNKQLQADKAAAEKKLAAANGRIRELETQVDNMILKSDHERLLGEKDDIIAELRIDKGSMVSKEAIDNLRDSKNATISRLEGRIAELQEEGRELRRAINALEKEKENNGKELEELKGQIAGLSSTNEESSAAIASEIAAVKAALAAAEEELRTAKKKDDEQKKEIERLGIIVAEVESLRAANGALTEQLAAAQSALLAATSSSGDLAGRQQGRIAELEGQIRSLRGQIAEQASELARLRPLTEKSNEDDKTIAGLRGQVASLIAQNKSLLEEQSSVSSLQSNLEDALTQKRLADLAIEDLSRDIRALQKTNADLVAKFRDCDEAKRKLKTAEEQLGRVQGIFDKQQREFDAAFAAQLAKVAEAQAALASAQAELADAEGERGRLASSVVNLSAQLSEMMGINQALLQELEQLRRICAPKIELPRANSFRQLPLAPITRKKEEYNPTGISGSTNPNEDADRRINQVISHQEFKQAFTRFINSYNQRYTNQNDFKDAFTILRLLYRDFITIRPTQVLDKTTEIKTKLLEIQDYLQRISVTLTATTHGNFGSSILQKGKTNIIKEKIIDVLISLVVAIDARNPEKSFYKDKLATVGGNFTGGSKDPLYKYAIQIANDRLDDFLIEEPLPFFGLIKSFDKSIIRETNESYLLEKFVVHQLETHFDNDEMKDFFTQFNLTFDKTNHAELCFVLYEICNKIKNSTDADVVKLQTTEYNSEFDELEQTLKNSSYDFYDTASKQLLELKPIDIKYHEGHIYFKPKTDSFVNTYVMDDKMNLEKAEYTFNEETYLLSNKLLYFFFIMSVYNSVKSEIKDKKIVDTLLKHTRTTKRNLKKSAKKLIKEKLDG